MISWLELPVVCLRLLKLAMKNKFEVVARARHFPCARVCSEAYVATRGMAKHAHWHTHARTHALARTHWPARTGPQAPARARLQASTRLLCTLTAMQTIARALNLQATYASAPAGARRRAARHVNGPS